MHANWPLFRSSLDQLIVTNPRIEDRTDLKHTILLCSASSCIHSHSPTHRPVPSPYSLPSLVNLMKLGNYYQRRYQISRFRLFHLLHQLLSSVLTSRLAQLRNSKWFSFLGTLHPSQNHFGKSPGTSRPHTICSSLISPRCAGPQPCR